MLTDADVMAYYERTCDEVYRYASRLAGGDRSRAEDLVQETFLTLVRQVRAGRTEPVDVGWAIATCRSRFLDQLRRDGSADRATGRAFERAPSTAPDVGAAEALARVPEEQRAALVLRYVDDLSVAAVARAIGRTVHATESLLARARDSFRNAYATGSR